MVIPKSYLFLWTYAFAMLFFTFSDEEGLLPIDYVYVMFALAMALIAPFLLRRHIERRSFFVVLSLFCIGALSSYGSGVPSAVLYSIGLIMLLLAQSDEGICRSQREQTLFARYIAFTLLACGVAGIPLLEPNYHGRLFLPHVGNPNYTAMLYLGMFVSVQAMVPILRGLERRLFSSASLILFGWILLVTETRSAALALAIFVIFRLMARLKRDKLIRNAASSLVIITATGQLLAYYVFVAVGVDSDARTTLGFFDASNMIRVTAFHTAMMVVLNDSAFLWHGVGNVDGIWTILAASGDVQHVPHNWFMMMWLSNGALFTLLALGIIFQATRRLPIHFLPGLAALLIIALIVGRAVLFAPLCMFLMCGMMRTPPRIIHTARNFFPAPT